MKMAGVIVMWVMLAALALCALLWPLARHADRRGRSGLLHSALSNLRRLTLSTLLALFTAFIGSVAHSGKTNGGTGTTGILPVATVANGYVIPTGGTPVVPGTVTPQEITQGYRLESVTTNDAVSYAMPTNGVEYAPWNLRGGYETHFPLDLGDFAFPFGTSVVHRLDVLSGGTVESLPRQRMDGAYYSLMSICAAREWASIVPGVGRFWWADAAAAVAGRPPYRTKLLTWENVYAERDRTGLYNAQIELFGDGNFITRSNDVERVYRRVLPFDWDDDGLENSVDPDPFTAGPDSHGTNAEWYNAVCSNIVVAAPGGSGVPPLHLGWREGVNSNAYYFVDVIAAQGPAPIFFTGDRDSRLGNPVVVARGGETNRVPLLIGIDYAVTSTVPFMVSFPDDGFATVTTNGVANYTVQWPLNFVFTESIDGSSRVYSVRVAPYDPGGELTWNAAGGGMRSSGMRSGVSSECCCGCLHYGDWTVCFTCSSTCTCDSRCKVLGYYTIEQTIFPVEGGMCRCGLDDPPPDGSAPNSHEPTDPPSLTITFSKQAVLFEDEYEDDPGVIKPRRSTRVRLTIDAYGGAQGGTLWITGMNMDKLIAIDGDVTLPYSQEIPANTAYHASSVYEGVSASVSVNDVMVNGSLLLNGQSTQIDSLAQLTSMKIELQTVREAPSNPSMHRHVHGIGEMVLLNYHPSGNVALDLVDAHESGTGSARLITWGISNVQHQLTIRLADARYVPMISVLTPNGIEGQRVQSQTFGLPAGVAGGLALVQRYRVHPLNVSFEGLSIEEVPCDEEIPPEGYFVYTATNVFHRSHTRAAKAGVWVTVSSGNILGGPDSFDKAGFTGSLQRRTPEGVLTDDPTYGWCTGGSLTWKIPFGWNKHPHSLSADPVERFAEETRQVFRISANGDFRMEKLGHYAERKIDGRVFVDDHEDDGILNNN